MGAFLKWAIRGCAVALMFGAQVGPKDARSNISEWVDLIGVQTPAWLKQPVIDKWGFWFGLGVLVLSFSAWGWRRLASTEWWGRQVIRMYPLPVVNVPAADSGEMSLTDAASRAYGETRGTLASELAERQNKKNAHDGILCWYARWLSQHDVEITGIQSPSTMREIVPVKSRQFQVRSGQLVAVDQYSGLYFTDLKVEKVAVLKAIERLKKTAKEASL
jgi:hypothetical protein